MSEMTRNRPALWRRSQGRCEISGRAIEYDTFDAHHRRNKGMGGTTRPDRDALSNLLALHPEVHNGGPLSVHGRREWSEEHGYLIPKHVAVAATWPVLLRTGWALLGDDGKVYPLPPSFGRQSAAQL